MDPLDAKRWLPRARRRKLPSSKPYHIFRILRLRPSTEPCSETKRRGARTTFTDSSSPKCSVARGTSNASLLRASTTCCHVRLFAFVKVCPLSTSDGGARHEATVGRRDPRRGQSRGGDPRAGRQRRGLESGARVVAVARRSRDDGGAHRRRDDWNAHGGGRAGHDARAARCAGCPARRRRARRLRRASRRGRARGRARGRQDGLELETRLERSGRRALVRTTTTRRRRDRRPPRPPDAQLGLRFGVRADGAQGARGARGRGRKNKHTRGDESAPALARRAPRGFVDAAAPVRDDERVDDRLGAPPAFVRRVRRGAVHGHDRREPRVFQGNLLQGLDQGRRGAGVEALRRRGGQTSWSKRSVCLRNVKRWAAARVVSSCWWTNERSCSSATRRIRWRDEYGDASPREFDAVRVEENKHSKHSNETRSESFSTGAAILDRVFERAGPPRNLRGC